MDAETYVSWAIASDGPEAVGGLFFVDLYFDGVVVARWETAGMARSQMSFVADWDKLGSLVRLDPGTHTLSLVVDSTGLISETDESDNVFQSEFAWEPSSGAPATATPVPERLPDLVPFTPDGWSGPIVATSYLGDTVDGPLSVDVTGYVRSAIRNQGLSSTPRDVWVYLYLDDVLVDMTMLEGLLADAQNARAETANLLQVTKVSPGEHILKMVLDPNDLIVESNEDNNVLEKRFAWGTGPVEPKPLATSTPGPACPEPLTLPNLAPGWRFGRDGPIIVSTEQHTSLDSALSLGWRPFIDLTVTNLSVVAAKAPFSVGLYYDDKRVHTFEFGGPTPGKAIRWVEDWDGLPDKVRITEGPHTLRIVIDPSNAVEEANEDDNTYEKGLVWASGDPVARQPITYSTNELRRMLADLESLLDIREAALSPDGPAHTQEILRVADAGYYLMTGKSLLDERVDIALLTRPGFLSRIDEDFEEEFAVSRESECASLLVTRERIKENALGFKSRRFGKVSVVVDAKHSVAGVIDALAHELGHMRQDFLNPAQTSAAAHSYAVAAVQEAEAQQFQRAFWLTLDTGTWMRQTMGHVKTTSSHFIILTAQKQLCIQGMPHRI